MPASCPHKPYQAFGPRDAETGVKPCLGGYRTAVDAAVAYAHYVRVLRETEATAAGGGADATHPCFSVPAEADGMKLHLSHRSQTGYEGVRRFQPAGAKHVRYRAIAPMVHGHRQTDNLGYYATAVEAAVAFAKYVASPAEFRAERSARPRD